MKEDTTDPIEFNEKSPLILEADAKGTPFIVKLLNLESGSEDLLINYPGDEFAGTIITTVEAGRYVFNLTYGDSYDLTSVGLSEEDILEPPIDRKGSAFEIIPVKLSGATRFSIENDENHCIVTRHNQLGEKEDLVVNDPNPGKRATTIVEEGLGIFQIKTYGNWELSIENL